MYNIKDKDEPPKHIQMIQIEKFFFINLRILYFSKLSNTLLKCISNILKNYEILHVGAS